MKPNGYHSPPGPKNASFDENEIEIDDNTEVDTDSEDPDEEDEDNLVDVSELTKGGVMNANNTDGEFRRHDSISNLSLVGGMMVIQKEVKMSSLPTSSNGSRPSLTPMDPLVITLSNNKSDTSKSEGGAKSDGVAKSDPTPMVPNPIPANSGQISLASAGASASPQQQDPIKASTTSEPLSASSSGSQQTVEIDTPVPDASTPTTDAVNGDPQPSTEETSGLNGTTATATTNADEGMAPIENSEAATAPVRTLGIWSQYPCTDDKGENSFYWYNTSTGETQWETPRMEEVSHDNLDDI